ncbi:ribonuclease P protein component [Fibrella sp. HMF5335]|uniref:Ribonuclease P protein component n=1 Tax=Fibrella rubiginis TaxID=2817060 RepID=A0A939GFJ4_9BACT|nr:ribonuclease P protein component [Fibrella rubiginis]MBO0936314.1 ribonuclease P protein component [Fibrella rubiginis]
MRFTFPKTERLTSKKVIDQLFHRPKPGEPTPIRVKSGSTVPPETFYLFPFRVIYFRQPTSVLPTDGTAKEITLETAPPQADTCQVLFSVPKRTFKKAVDRNAIRRRLREAYRLHKHTLTSPPASIAFLYTAKAKISFEEIEKGMKLALKRMYNA